MTFKIKTPDLLFVKEEILKLNVGELMGLAFDLGAKRDFTSKRAFQLIKEQISERYYQISFQDSFDQAQDFSSPEQLLQKLDSL